jgi:hypothetical protein
MYGRGGAGNLAQAAASNKKAAEVYPNGKGCIWLIANQTLGY